MNLIKNSKAKGKKTDKLASVKRLPSPIPTKTSKEVNKISKYFKSKALAHSTNKCSMSYIQISKDGSNTKSILKIKKAFPTLKANNIDNIQ